MNLDKLKKTHESRCKSVDVKYHAHEAISHFENLVAGMAKLQNMTREEYKNG